MILFPCFFSWVFYVPRFQKKDVKRCKDSNVRLFLIKVNDGNVLLKKANPLV